MFKINTMERCPFVRGSQGLITLPHDVIAAISGAVDGDDNEWMMFLHGKRSQDGTRVHVSHYSVPQHSRTGVNCTLPEGDIDPSVVGILHSHHSMSAFFSHTDDTKLNPRFPSSIVVARLNSRGQRIVTDDERSLGFTYQAEVRAKLPCGDIGIIQANVEPSPRPAFWLPREARLQADKHNDIGDCENYESVHNNEQEPHLSSYVASCGERETSRKMAFFGDDGKELLADIKANGKLIQWKAKHQGNGGYSEGSRHHRGGHRRYIMLNGKLVPLAEEDDLGDTQHWGVGC